MNWLEFAEKMVGHLAWPIVVLIIVFAVRKHLGSLAERILELSFGGATVKFDKLLSKGAKLIEQAEEEGPEDELSAEELSERLAKHLKQLEDIRSQPPSEGQALILFRDIELKLVEIGLSLGMAPQRGRLQARDVIERLRASKKLDRSFVELFDTLQKGRNLLAHAKQLGEREIAEYVDQASFFLVQLDMWKERLARQKPK